VTAALVSGAAGWLGRRLVLALTRGLPDVAALSAAPPARVRCLVVNRDEEKAIAALAPEAECAIGNLRDPVSLVRFAEGADGGVLFHCAGVIHPRRIREFYDVNVEGTHALLDAAARAGIQRFVHVSSNSPFGSHASSEDAFDEESPYHPYRHYGRSKRLAEELVREAGARGAMQVVIARAPWFYGPGGPERQTRFLQMVKRGRVPLVGGGRNVRSMSYVDNLCQGLLLCARVDAASGRSYWIADRRAYAMREIVDTVAGVLEQDFGMTTRRQRALPAVVGRCAALADGAIQSLGLYQQEIHVLSEMNQNIACSIARAERELGYDPRIELREGMRRTIAALLGAGAAI
jgi:nucleoside-diphosphate-sugar epimerase